MLKPLQSFSCSEEWRYLDHLRSDDANHALSRHAHQVYGFLHPFSNTQSDEDLDFHRQRFIPTFMKEQNT